MTKRAALLLSTLFALATTISAGEEFSLKLSVTEPTGVERKSAEVRGGVPLERGRFKKDQAFAVFEGDKEIPAQVLPLVVDGEDCLRWIVIDLQTDLAANQKKEFTLKAAKGSAAPARAVKVSSDEEGTTVDTGRLRFTISKKQPFSLFTTVEIDGKAVAGGGNASYTDSTPMEEKDWKKCAALAPSGIEVERAGSMRATLKVSGGFDGDEGTKMKYAAWITAWAGRPDVHVKYALINSNSEQYVFRRIKNSIVNLKLSDAVESTVIGAREPIEAGADAWLRAGLINKWFFYGRAMFVKGAVRAGSGEEELWSSKDHNDLPGGWIFAKTGQGGVFVSDRFLWENPVRGIAVKDGHLSLGGVLENFEPGEYVVRGKTVKGGQPYISNGRWLLDCNHLSSEYVINFAAPQEKEQLVRLGKLARARLHLLAPLDWYFETESLSSGKFATQAEEIQCYEKWGWKHDPKKAPKGPGMNRYHGSERTLPRWVDGTDNHYDSEADVLEMLVVMYLRTGERRYFDFAQAWANHEMDLRIFRTDGWRWSGGGVWWSRGGPVAGCVQNRKLDAITGWGKSLRSKTGYKLESRKHSAALYKLIDRRQCYCHNYAAGIAAWHCISGEEDALAAAIDSVEQTRSYFVDYGRKVYGRFVAGKHESFSRAFTRGLRATNAVRLIAPADKWVVAWSDEITDIYLKRPRPELRGMPNPPPTVAKPKNYKGPLTPEQIKVKFYGKQHESGPYKGRYKVKGILNHVSEKAVKKAEELGIKMCPETGALIDPRTGKKWNPVKTPHYFMYPMIYVGMDSYRRETGNEDAHDWQIAIGKAFAQITYQPYGNFAHYSIGLVDFPLRGICKDKVTWAIEGTDNKWAEGKEFKISGYSSRKWPDACARAYSLCGEPFLKKRAYDYWYGGSHRGYAASALRNKDGVGSWPNMWQYNDDHVNFNGHTFYIHAHPRTDEKPPKAITDLAVKRANGKVTVEFTAPGDEGGGKTLRYQVKCSDKPIVGYEAFLEKFNKFEEDSCTNWWLARNFKGEPAAKAPGARESFTLEGAPEGAKYFAVRAYDDSSNRSKISNVAEAE
jgi:hypothetical protein